MAPRLKPRGSPWLYSLREYTARHDGQLIQDRPRIVIPEAYRIGHEAHFAEVTSRFLQYLRDGKLPDWEEPGMLAKYYVTTQALVRVLAK